MDLYHADIRLPDWFTPPKGRVPLYWTRHALDARQNDRYGRIPKFDTVNLSNLVVIEVGVTNGVLSKIVYRGRYTDELDICMVLIPDLSYYRGPWTVKTVWINKRTDKHGTLDRSKYVH